jgi:hypothetical protein
MLERPLRGQSKSLNHHHFIPASRAAKNDPSDLISSQRNPGRTPSAPGNLRFGSLCSTRWQAPPFRMNVAGNASKKSQKSRSRTEISTFGHLRDADAAFRC